MFKTHNKDSVVLAPGRTYSSNEVCRVANVTMRQLQWWDERNLVSPRHHEHRRLYTAEEAIEVIVIAELRRKGISMQKVSAILPELRKQRAAYRLGTNNMHLITDGRTLSWESDAKRIVSMINGSRRPMFVISLTDQVMRRLDQTGVAA